MHCSINMQLPRPWAVSLIAALMLTQLGRAAPRPQNDIDDGYVGGPQDYNSVVGHFKDFFMYLPVLMSTVKDTMTGFPKFAEGLRILTSKTGRREDDCDCKQNSNELENNSRYS